MTNEQLVIRIKAWIDVAENMLQLWQQNQGFIETIAKRFRGYEDMEDLRQQGYIGLCNAVDGYNPDEGVLFLTYAGFWIRQSMQRYIEECGSVVRISVHCRNRIREYEKFCRTFELYYGRKPTDGEISCYLDMDEEKLASIRKSAQMSNIGSLDVPVGEGEEGTMYDLLPGAESPEEDIVEKLQQEQLQDTLWGMVDDLPGQQPTVIRMRYQEGKSLKEAGDRIGCTVNQASDIQHKALRAMREPRRARVLQSLMYGDSYSKALRGNGVEHFNRTWTSSTEYTAIEETEHWLQRMFPDRVSGTEMVLEKSANISNELNSC